MMRHALIAAMLLAVMDARAAGIDRESAVKAAFVFNILKFSQLPTSDLRNRDLGLKLCVLNDQPVFAALRSLSGRPARGGALEVVEIDALEALPRCDAVFVGHRWRGDAERMAADAKAHGVLTLTEDAARVREGLMIGIVPDGARLAIEINVPATRAAGIRLSAELLQLSRLIDTGAGKEEPR